MQKPKTCDYRLKWWKLYIGMKQNIVYLIFWCARGQTFYSWSQLNKHISYGGDPRVKVFVSIVLWAEILLVALSLLQTHDWAVHASWKMKMVKTWKGFKSQPGQGCSTRASQQEGAYCQNGIAHKTCQELLTTLDLTIFHTNSSLQSLFKICFNSQDIIRLLLCSFCNVWIWKKNQQVCQITGYSVNSVVELTVWWVFPSRLSLH